MREKIVCKVAAATALVVGMSLTLGFSWLALAERIGMQALKDDDKKIGPGNFGLVVLDCGTGIIPLGNRLSTRTDAEPPRVLRCRAEVVDPSAGPRREQP